MNNVELLKQKGIEIERIDVARGEDFFFSFELARTPQLCERFGQDFEMDEKRALEVYKEKYGPQICEDEIVDKIVLMDAIRIAKEGFIAHWYSEDDTVLIIDRYNVENHIVLEGDEKELFKTVVYEEYLRGYFDLVQK